MTEEFKAYSEKLSAEAKLASIESKSYIDTLIAEVRLTARDDKAYADRLFSEAKMAARDEAEKAKRSALAILGSVALLLGIATTLGLKAYFETRISTAAAAVATAVGKKAEEGGLKALLDTMRSNLEKSEALASEIAVNRNKAKVFLEELLRVGSFPPSSDSKMEGAKGYIQLGTTLICYGEQPLTGATHTRSFAFTFSREFARPPTITSTANVNGSGFNFAVYKYRLTTADYIGSVVESQARSTDASTVMSYIAIGEAKDVGPSPSPAAPLPRPTPP